jgi:arylsulfatase A-like enzyme
MNPLVFTSAVKLILGTIASACTVHPLLAATRPNFIVIYTDDHRADGLGFVNPRVSTPNLDQLAGRGVYFPQAFTISALCSPSRAQLLTGRYASQNGVTELASSIGSQGPATSTLNRDEPIVFRLLGDAGYTTGLVGKWHLETPPSDCGFAFQRYFYGNGDFGGVTFRDESGREMRTTRHVEAENARFGREFLNHAQALGKPFALFYNTRLPHMDNSFEWPVEDESLEKHPIDGFSPPRSWTDRLAGKPAYLRTGRNRAQAEKYGYRDSSRLAQHQRAYYAAVSEMDAKLGEFLDEIERLGLFESTYIVVMGDNGWFLGEHRFTSKVLAYEESIRVPLIIAGPSVRPSVSDALALNIDIAPTLLAWAHLPEVDNIYGRSLAGTVNGDHSPVRNAFLYEMPPAMETARNPYIRALRDSRFKLIRTYDATGMHPTNEDELYDLNIDPGEEANLATMPAYASVVAEMRTKLESEIKAVAATR